MTGIYCLMVFYCERYLLSGFTVNGTYCQVVFYCGGLLSGGVPALCLYLGICKPTPGIYNNPCLHNNGFDW